ncbi:MAG: acetyl-CoA carboxylase biotin carboxylase subunit family protein [Spirochaetales bacterium]
MKQHVFVLGLDAENRDILERTPGLEDCEFHCLLDHDELRGVERFPVRQLLETCESRLNAHARAHASAGNATVDAIITLLDFPATELVPILCERFGVPGPSLDAVLGCNHKYWSRLLQREAAPDHVPEFAAFDPYDPSSISRVAQELDYPFWVKPMNAYRSHLGYRVASEEELEDASEVFREQLPRLSDPLRQIMHYVDVPPAVASLPQHACIAEGIIGGRQCTVEGYAQHGTVVVYGVVDSIRESNGSTFSRYQYPSHLPKWVQQKMETISRVVIERIGFDNSAFNAEFYYQPSTGKVWLLEINPRASQSHAFLFERVDGASNQSVVVDVALGREPHMPHRDGPSKVAAKCFVHAFRDAVISSLPEPADLRRIESAVPDSHITMLVDEGTQLSALLDEDAYSYELADIYLGASTQKELLERRRRCLEMLDFTLGSAPKKRRRRRARVQRLGAVPHAVPEGGEPEESREAGGGVA